MMNTQFAEMAKAVSDTVDAGNAIIAATIALAAGIAIFIRRYIVNNK